MAAINTKVKKAVIPVAGLGTRMLPATKAAAASHVLTSPNSNR